MTISPGAAARAPSRARRRTAPARAASASGRRGPTRRAPGIAARDRGAVEGRVELVLLELEPAAQRPAGTPAPRQPFLSLDDAGRLAEEVGALARARRAHRAATRAGSRPRRRRGSGRGRARARRASGRRTCGRSSAWSVGSAPMLPLEAVPNFSEGRDRATIDAIGEALAAHARLLDVHSDADHNRSRLHARRQRGGARRRAARRHRRAPRADRPAPPRGRTPTHRRRRRRPARPDPGARRRARADGGSRAGAASGGRARACPSSSTPTSLPGRGPAFFRRGGPAELQRRIDTGELAPDFGPAQLDERAGGVLIGARPPLIAFNVNLAGDDLDAAREVARAVRERDGGFPGVRALGLRLPRAGHVQVSLNVENWRASPLHEVVARRGAGGEREGASRDRFGARRAASGGRRDRGCRLGHRRPRPRPVARPRAAARRRLALQEARRSRDRSVADPSLRYSAGGCATPRGHVGQRADGLRPRLASWRSGRRSASRATT